MDIIQSSSIITLDSSLDPLKNQFNDNNKEKIRFLSLLSPTCPLWRDQGVRALHETIIRNFSHADISATIVWIPILDKDNIEAALPSVKFLSDKRFKHLYDQHQNVGKTIANRVGWIGKVAWDTSISFTNQMLNGLIYRQRLHTGCISWLTIVLQNKSTGLVQIWRTSFWFQLRNC